MRKNRPAAYYQSPESLVTDAIRAKGSEAVAAFINYIQIGRSNATQAEIRAAYRAYELAMKQGEPEPEPVWVAPLREALAKRGKPEDTTSRDYQTMNGTLITY